MKRAILYSVAIVLSCTGLFNQSAQARTGSGRTRQAATLKYDPVTDELLHRKSVLTPAPEYDPDRHGLYGSYLDQFRFIGKKGRGGIYDAIDLYIHQKKLDPQKYRARIRR